MSKKQTLKLQLRIKIKICIYNYFMSVCQNKAVETEQVLKYRFSNSTTNTQNADPTPNKIFGSSDPFFEQTRIYRVGLFRNNLKFQNLPKKINKSAIGWIQAQCWSQNTDLETTSLATILYYCYASNKEIQKQQVQPLLLACLLLSNKFYGGSLVKIEDALKLVANSYDPSTIIKIQHQILNFVEFDLFFPTILHIIQKEQQEEQNYFAICFCIQLLALKSYDIFFNQDKLYELNLFVVKDAQNLPTVHLLKQMMKFSQAQILINKYRAKFRVDDFLKKLL